MTSHDDVPSALSIILMCIGGALMVGNTIAKVVQAPEYQACTSVMVQSIHQGECAGYLRQHDIQDAGQFAGSIMGLTGIAGSMYRRRPYDYTR